MTVQVILFVDILIRQDSAILHLCTFKTPIIYKID